MALNIELRKVSHSKSLSEETPAYSAQVWIDGVHFCDVSNHGQGGSDMQHPPKGVSPNDTGFRDRLAALEKRIAAEYPKHSYQAGGETHSFDESFEGLCQGLLYRREVEAAVRRDLKAKVMFVKPTDGKVYSVKIPKGAAADRLIAVVKQMHKIDRTINEMPFDKAVELLSA